MGSEGRHAWPLPAPASGSTASTTFISSARETGWFAPSDPASTSSLSTRTARSRPHDAVTHPLRFRSRGQRRRNPPPTTSFSTPTATPAAQVAPPAPAVTEAASALPAAGANGLSGATYN